MIDRKAGSSRPAPKFARPNRFVFGRLDDLRARGANACNNLKQRRLQGRATLRSDRNFGPWHSRVLSILRRTGSLRASAEAADSDDLFEVRVDSGVRDRIGRTDCRAGGIRTEMSAPSTSEERLDQLRTEAREKGNVIGRGVTVAGGPIPRLPGYYGRPVVRPPVWTWEIPIYFFIGGLAGMSALIAAAGLFFHQPSVTRTAMYISGAGALISPLLLILDLGRPRLFINMLRVFKPQSAMSMGVWILVSFSLFVFPGLLTLELRHFQLVSGSADDFVHWLSFIFICGSAFFGTLLATYTGVLLGATVIPAWFLHRTLLPVHFGIAGLGSAAALLELLGHRVAPLHLVGFTVASIEIALAIWLLCDRHGAADRALHHGLAGWLIRSAELLTGPIALLFRLVGLIPLAAISFLLGVLISRIGWIRAGKFRAQIRKPFLPRKQTNFLAGGRFLLRANARVFAWADIQYRQQNPDLVGWRSIVLRSSQNVTQSPFRRHRRLLASRHRQLPTRRFFLDQPNQQGEHES